MEKQNFDDNKSIQKDKFHGNIKIMWKEISENIKQNYPSNLKKIPSLGSLSKK